MLSSVALRAQIASIIDALSKAAVTEIAKVVEDGMVVLRLEMCQRENEIKKLKSNIEVLHNELRSLQGSVTLRPDHHGRDDSQSNPGDERTSLEKEPSEKDQNGRSIPELQVKCEPMEEGSEAGGQPDQLGEAPSWHERTSAHWRPTSESIDSDYLNLGHNSLSCLPKSPPDPRLAEPCSSSSGFQPSPFSRGLPGYGQHRNSYNAVRRRTVKRSMFKKGFICPYCGKCFERSGHLERHKRIHTGEKPYRCEICGRRFNQKCSLKEHTKIHRRCIQPGQLEIKLGEQKLVPDVKPCSDALHPEEEGQGKAGDGLAKTEDVLTTIHVKSEPTEEKIAPPPFLGGNGQTREGGDDLTENYTTFERDSQLWMSSSKEYLCSSAQSMTSFQGIAQLLPPPVEASCSTFSFPGKPYGELQGNKPSQLPYGSSDTLMKSNETDLQGMMLNHHLQRGSNSFQVVKPKKCFICSYCGKVFERAGHLERHLRIHTGEKPYGCHICGRCFSQKSSLKGHMKTHRNGENTDVLEASQLMFTMPDNQPLKNSAEHKTGLAALEEQLLGSTYGEAVGEQTVLVKLEPKGEVFDTQAETGNAVEQSQLWTPGMEKSSDAEQTVCVLLHDVNYQLGPAAGASNEQQGYTSPMQDLPFPGDKEKEGIMLSDPYSIMSIEPAPGLQDQHGAPELAVNEYMAVSDRNHEGGVFEFKMSASRSRADSCGEEDAIRQNSFICSACGQSFDSFSSFQRHQCENITEQSFSCEKCGKIFNQMSILKLHLKLHVE